MISFFGFSGHGLKNDDSILFMDSCIVFGPSEHRALRLVGRSGLQENENSVDMTYNARRVLVTGGSGFLGSHLCERLLEQGHEVLCVDNFFTGRRSNVGHLLSEPRFELLRHDITFPLYAEVDEIYNLALSLIHI